VEDEDDTGFDDMLEIFSKNFIKALFRYPVRWSEYKVDAKKSLLKYQRTCAWLRQMIMPFWQFLLIQDVQGECNSNFVWPYHSLVYGFSNLLMILDFIVMFQLRGKMKARNRAAGQGLG